MVVTWEVDDGYVGKSASHQTKIDDLDLEECDSEEEREELIQEAVQSDFEQKITWHITNRE